MQTKAFKRKQSRIFSVLNLKLSVNFNGPIIKISFLVLVAFSNDLVIVPVLNKIDLPNADTETVKDQVNLYNE